MSDATKGEKFMANHFATLEAIPAFEMAQARYRPLQAKAINKKMTNDERDEVTHILRALHAKRDEIVHSSLLETDPSHSVIIPNCTATANVCTFFRYLGYKVQTIALSDGSISILLTW